MSEQTCAATVGCKRAPTVGYVCAGHFARLGDTLTALRTEVDNLSAVPSMQAKSGRGGGLASHRSPARLDVLVHTDRRRGSPDLSDASRADPLAYDQTPSVLETLHSWARMVREERGLDVSGPATIATERETLSRHLEWICHQPWVDEAYRDLTNLLGALRSANGTAPEKPSGRCYLPDETTGTGTCDGPIWLDEASGHASCGRCKQTWDGPQLAMLSYEMKRARAEAARPRTEDGRPMLTAEELVARGKVSSVSNVRVIAHRRGRVSVAGHYDPQWFGKEPA